MAEVYKMLDTIGNREDHDQTASEALFDFGLHRLSRPI